MTSSTVLRVVNDPALVQSSNDRRVYRRIQLPNGIRVTIVQHEVRDDDDDGSEEASGGRNESETGNDDEGHNKPAAVALAIRIGHFNDPDAVPGLAHLLEHMLFMGTSKHPAENEWETFLNLHGGWSNASTCEETTMFFYEIHPDYLPESLDRFAQFFIDPLLSIDAIDREINAVDSEFKECYQSDQHRIGQVMCHIARTGHPLAKFGWGNLTSLTANTTTSSLSSELRQFQQKYYDPSRMSLVVMTHDVELAERDIVISFGAIPDHHNSSLISKPCDLPAPAFTYPDGVSTPFDLSKCSLLEIVPVTELYTIEMVFQGPPVGEGYSTGCASYWGEVIGDEGPGSAIYILRDLGLATSLEAGMSTEQTYQTSLYSLFTIHVSLSKAGFVAWAKVCELIFAYINHVVRSGPQRFLWEQYASIARANFDWSEPKEPADHVEDLAHNMGCFHWEDILTGSMIWNTYDPCLLSKYGDLIHAKNVLVILVGSDLNLEEPCIEPYFGTEFRCSLLDPSMIASWLASTHPDMSLPTLSALLPANFDIIPRPKELSDLPVLIYSDAQCRTWHLLDSEHIVPRGHVAIRFDSPLTYSTARHAVMTTLSLSIIEDQLMPYLYDGEVAQLSMSLRPTRKGLQLLTDGFSDRLLEYTLQIAMHLFNVASIDSSRFSLMKERLVRTWSCAYYLPAEQVTYERLRLLQDPKHSIESLRSALNDLTVDDMSSFMLSLKPAGVHFDVFVHGNISGEQALNFTSSLIEICGRFSKPILSITPSVILIPRGSSLVRTVSSFNETEPMCAHCSYFQIGQDSVKNRAVLKLFERIAAEMCFDALRTRGQLGYSVSLQHLNTDGILGLTIEVVSGSHSVQDCDRQIDNWLKEELTSTMRSMTRKTLASHTEGFLLELESCDYCLSVKHDRLWDEISQRTYCFDRIDQELDIIEDIKLKDINRILSRITDPNARSKLSIQVLGTGPEKLNQPPNVPQSKDRIESVEVWKSRFSKVHLADNQRQ